MPDISRVGKYREHVIYTLKLTGSQLNLLHGTTKERWFSLINAGLIKLRDMDFISVHTEIKFVNSP